MWFIHTIIFFINISITPFCVYGGKIPMQFNNYKTCDIAIDNMLSHLENENQMNDTIKEKLESLK